MDYTQIARQYIENGFNVIPILCDGSKRAARKWKEQQTRLSSDEELRQWYDRPNPYGIGIVMGAISGNLHGIDFDHEAETHYQRWRVDVEHRLPGVISKVIVVKTPRPGFQVWFRQQSAPAKQQVLARSEPEPNGKIDADGKPIEVPRILIETRGSGNYAVGVGSPAAVHKTGRPYELIQGSFNTLEALTDTEVDTLLDICRSYTRFTPQHVQRQPGQRYQGEPRPGDVFNELADIKQLLIDDGWQLHHVDGNGVEHWTRPGKLLSNGTSATLGAMLSDDGKPLLYVFTDAASPFQANTAYDAFAAYTMLKHGGDFATAAAAARIQYAEQVQSAQVRWRQNNTPEPVAYVPFPVNLLPEVVQTYVSEHAQAIGIDPAFVAVPMLAVMASLIGQTRKLQVKRDWVEPAILWCATIADVSTGKTPGWQAATEPAHRIERMLNDRRKQMDLQYKDALSTYEASDKTGPKPARQLFNTQLTIDDCTMETLADIHNNNWRGLLLSVDELAAWLQSFNVYRGGKGRDVENWLSIYNGKHMQVNRKTERYRMYLPSTAVSVCGTIQPEVAASTLFSEGFIANGFSARVLSAMPPSQIVRWSDLEVSEQTDNAMFDLARRLFDLTGEQYQPDIFRSIFLPFAEDAKELFKQYLDQTADHAESQEPALRSAWLKLRPAAARFALVFSVVQQLQQYPQGQAMQPVDAKSTTAGIGLAWWFGKELERNYKNGMRIGRPDTVKSHLAWIRDRYPTGIEARQLQQGRRSIETAEQARTVLQQLINAGHGRLAGTLFIPS